MDYTARFQRIEKKYLLDEEQYAALLTALSGRMEREDYGNAAVCNIYLDTPDHLLIRRSLEGRAYKEKLRLRSYGVPGDETQVYLEIKKKVCGIVYKRRIACSARDAAEYLKGGAPCGEGQIFREIDEMLRRYPLSPAVYIAYDREAYHEMGGVLRITFDRSIRYRETQLDLRQGDVGALLNMAKPILMEVKAPGAIPLWLCAALSLQKLYPVSFSKYGRVYMQTQAKDGGERPCSTAFSKARQAETYPPGAL